MKQCTFTAPHGHSAHLFISPSPAPSSQPPHPDLFTISNILPFPGWQRVGITQDVAFPDCLLSLGDRHLGFLYVFSGLMTRFFSALNNIPLPRQTTVYPFTEYWTSCLLLIFGGYEFTATHIQPWLFYPRSFAQTNQTPP